jgi:hypothetical protein
MRDVSRTDLDHEIAETEADLLAFQRAYDTLLARCVESRDTTKPRILEIPIQDWAGTHAVMNSLDVFINNIRRVLEELKDLREGTPPEPPRLRLVRENE